MFSKLSIVVASVLIVRWTLPMCARHIIDIFIVDPCCCHRHSPSPGHLPDLPPVLRQCVSSSSDAASVVAALLDLDLTGLDVPVGLSCSPVTIVGNNCGNTTVVCNAPNRSGVRALIAINCIPITL
ncbi:hypothetical protein B0H13DRAFT_2386693 [Mycena leptocephala]|nr:hypothetical protein B0H13DRAFT_2386693 [Mycena leptocephala]